MGREDTVWRNRHLAVLLNRILAPRVGAAEVWIHLPLVKRYLESNDSTRPLTSPF